MTSMPTINDGMVSQFRRTGRRRASYPLHRRGSLAGDGRRVVPQRSPGCHYQGQGCITKRGERGICDETLFCMADPFPGGFRI